MDSGAEERDEEGLDGVDGHCAWAGVLAVRCSRGVYRQVVRWACNKPIIVCDYF